MNDTSIIRPIFLATDPAAIVTQQTADFESLTGRSLYPAQYERLLINLIAYRESLVRIGVQLTGEQNLVAFATGDHLDHLGLLVGCTRFEAKSSKATERFSLSAPASSVVPIPAGTRVRSNDLRATFSVVTTGEIPIGQSFVDLTCASLVAGPGANGYPPGEITLLLDPISGVTASNVSTSADGLDRETDDAYRRRVILAPYQYGTAGSLGGYIYWALSMGAEYVDARATSPSGGQVEVALLMNTGVPTSEQLQVVRDLLMADYVRPVTDTVTVVAANRLTYTITASLTLYDTADQASVLAAANAAAQAYAESRKVRLGLDVTPAQVLAAILVTPGIYDLTLTQPAAVIVAGPGDWCDCTAVALTIAGTANG